MKLQRRLGCLLRSGREGGWWWVVSEALKLKRDLKNLDALPILCLVTGGGVTVVPAMVYAFQREKKKKRDDRSNGRG